MISRTTRISGMFRLRGTWDKEKKTTIDRRQVDKPTSAWMCNCDQWTSERLLNEEATKRQSFVRTSTFQIKCHLSAWQMQMTKTMKLVVIRRVKCEAIRMHRRRRRQRYFLIFELTFTLFIDVLTVVCHSSTSGIHSCVIHSQYVTTIDNNGLNPVRCWNMYDTQLSHRRYDGLSRSLALDQMRGRKRLSDYSRCFKMKSMQIRLNRHFGILEFQKPDTNQLKSIKTIWFGSKLTHFHENKTIICPVMTMGHLHSSSDWTGCVQSNW